MAFIMQLLLLVASLFAISNAHNLQLKAHSRECFFEELHKDDKMTVTFQVGDREFGGSGGNLEIDFQVRRNSRCAQDGGAVVEREAEDARQSTN